MAATNAKPDAAAASPSRPPRHRLERRLRVIRNELRELDAQLKKLNEEFCGLRLRECVSAPRWINARGRGAPRHSGRLRSNKSALPSGAQCVPLCARASSPTLGKRISSSHTLTHEYTHKRIASLLSILSLIHSLTNSLRHSFIYSRIVAPLWALFLIAG